ncbi:MAG: hypothetical protein U0575_05370 [Phycisphaerales bacterium]
MPLVDASRGSLEPAPPGVVPWPFRGSLLVDESESGLYHCVSRLRPPRAPARGGRRSPPRPGLVERLRTLCSAFAIGVVAFAVMNSHLHLILRTLPEAVGAWPDRVAWWLLVRPRAGRGRARRRCLGDAAGCRDRPTARSSGPGRGGTASGSRP